MVTVLELERGVRLVERRDAEQGAVLRRWLNGAVLTTFAGRVLPIDGAVARRSTALHDPHPHPERDALIAATALVHGLTVVTRNAGGYTAMGAAALDPWASG